MGSAKEKTPRLNAALLVQMAFHPTPPEDPQRTLTIEEDRARRERVLKDLAGDHQIVENDLDFDEFTVRVDMR